MNSKEYWKLATIVDEYIDGCSELTEVEVLEKITEYYSQDKVTDSEYAYFIGLMESLRIPKKF